MLPLSPVPDDDNGSAAGAVEEVDEAEAVAAAAIAAADNLVGPPRCDSVLYVECTKIGSEVLVEPEATEDVDGG